MDALKLAIREEKKAGAYYRSMAELTKEPRGKEMYKRLASEEELHEKIVERPVLQPPQYRHLELGRLN